MSEKLHAVIITLTTILLFFTTRRDDIIPFLPRLLVFYTIFSGAGYGYYLYARREKIVTKTTALFAYLVTVTVYILLGITGWFFSPFFYLVYVLAIFYTFIFGPLVSAALSITQIALYFYFFQSTGYQLGVSDFITILFLFGVVPGAYYLRRYYLLIAQQEKKILILEEKRRDYADSADEILANKVTRFSADLRQPVADIKQVALYSINKDKNTAASDRFEEIVELSDTALKKIEAFEKETTGRKLTHNT